jgi:hypothetical protein
MNLSWVYTPAAQGLANQSLSAGAPLSYMPDGTLPAPAPAGTGTTASICIFSNVTDTIVHSHPEDSLVGPVGFITHCP